MLNGGTGGVTCYYLFGSVDDRLVRTLAGLTFELPRRAGMDLAKVYLARAAWLALAVSLTGCGSYYLVRDPSTGNTYYTTDVDRAGDAGSVRFTDEKTGKVVTLPTSEVKKIDEYQYRSATGGAR